MARIDSLGEASPYRVPDRKRAQKKEKGRWRTFSRMVEEAGLGQRADDGGAGRRDRRSVEELLDEVFAAGAALKHSSASGAIFGFVEKSGGRLYNSAAIVGRTDKVRDNVGDKAYARQ